ncbi:tetratricopeptide repeat protein [Granulosicoccus antarcticus]|nr:tetratricopeptide repeat protein [Granulosicoccus antarcticus]
MAILALQSCAISFGSDDVLTPAHNKSNTHAQSQQLVNELNEADAAYAAGRWGRASAHYRVVLEQVPNDAYAWFRLGNTLTRQGQYSHAIQAFETSLQHEARQSKPWLNLSTAHLLGAQLATLKALEALARNEPSRQAVEDRLETLTQLLQ